MSLPAKIERAPVENAEYRIDVSGTLWEGQALRVGGFLVTLRGRSLRIDYGRGMRIEFLPVGGRCYYGGSSDGRILPELINVDDVQEASLHVDVPC